MLPHRGSTVQTLGILGLVFVLCPLIGFILGLIALILGNTDMAQIESGQMDPAGRDATSAGRTCGLIAVIVAPILFVIAVFVRLSTSRW
jgi:hypothetical protein